MIILNEAEVALRAIDEKELGNKPYNTIKIVAKYYLSTGMDKRTAREKLDEFMLACDPSVSLVSWSDTLDRAIRQATKYDIVNIENVPITSKELETIQSIDGVQIRKLAFALLCIAKYYVALDENNNYWVPTQSNEIMKMANISTSLKRQSVLFAKLREIGLIRFSKKVDNLSVQVLFADTDGEPAMSINDFRNLGHQYMMIYYDGYYVCTSCGIACKNKNNKETRGRKPKYCADCAIKVRTQQQVNSVMKRRAFGNDIKLVQKNNVAAMA